MLAYRGKLEDGERVDEKASDPNLYLCIRDLLIDEVTGDVERDSPTVKTLASRLRQEMSVYSMNKRDPFRVVAGADAGSQVLPLASRRYAVISALVYSLPSGDRFFLQPESIRLPYTLAGERLNGVVNVRREAKIYETARSFLEGEPGVDLLLIDGPLAFSNWWSMAGRERDRQRLIDAVNGLLDLCRGREVALAGVAKRPSARYLIYDMGLQDETELPDAFLLLHALEPGERTDIFCPRTAIRRAIRSSIFMDSVISPIYSFYGRFSGEWSIPPVRIDLPDFSLGLLDDVVDYCYGSSYWSGIPLPIVRADEEVRISKRFIGEIYGDIVSRVGRRRGEVSQLALYWGEGGWIGV